MEKRMPVRLGPEFDKGAGNLKSDGFTKVRVNNDRLQTLVEVFSKDRHQAGEIFNKGQAGTT
eukprot:4488307-Pyramimonas_sp.AAC.1